MVRRRRWIRLRVRTDNAMLHTDADLVKEKEETERRWLGAQAAEPDLPTSTSLYKYLVVTIRISILPQGSPFFGMCCRSRQI